MVSHNEPTYMAIYLKSTRLPNQNIDKKKFAAKLNQAGGTGKLLNLDCIMKINLITEWSSFH